MQSMKSFIFMLLAAAVTCASSQDISMEEMQMLDQWRAQYAAKGIQIKPEDEVRLLQRMRAMKAMTSPSPTQGASPIGQLLQQLVQQQAAMPQTQDVVTATSSESDLRKILDALPPGQQLSSFSLMRDGLKFNGQRYADPEGMADRFALDPETSTAAYVVQVGAAANVKIARLGPGAEPVTIGRLSKNGTRMVFQSLTGKTLSGDLFFPLTDGVLLVRDSVGFRYIVGEGTKQIDFPTGWSPAPLQRGNTSTTGWFLLERDTAEDKNNPFAIFKSIGEMAGALPARMDYALFNLNDRKMVEFEISADGKSVASYSQCRRSSNGLVNLCDKMTTYDSIWRTDGSPNVGHYFWKVDWQRMQGKPIAIVMERSLGQLNGFDLTGSKKVNLFERAMGINSWSMEMGGEGKYRIHAQLAFEKFVIDDVALEIQNRPEMPRKP